MPNLLDMIKAKTIVPLTAAFLLGVGVAHTSLFSQSTASPTLHGDAAHPAKTEGWVDTQLYFGLGLADASDADEKSKGVSEAAWRDFLDKEVSPRFPAGLSVVDVYGQW